MHLPQFVVLRVRLGEPDEVLDVVLSNKNRVSGRRISFCLSELLDDSAINWSSYQLPGIAPGALLSFSFFDETSSPIGPVFADIAPIIEACTYPALRALVS